MHSFEMVTACVTVSCHYLFLISRNLKFVEQGVCPVFLNGEEVFVLENIENDWLNS